MKSGIIKDMSFALLALLAYWIAPMFAREEPRGEEVAVARVVRKETKPLGSALTLRKKRTRVLDPNVVLGGGFDLLEAQIERDDFASGLTELLIADPESALLVGQAIDQGMNLDGMPDSFLDSVYRAYCRADQLEAWRWLDSLPEEQRVSAGGDGSKRGRVYDFFYWADRNRSEALDWLREQPPSEQIDEFASSVVVTSARADPSLATEFSEMIENEDRRLKAQRLIASGGVLLRWDLRGDRLFYTSSLDPEEEAGGD